MTTARAIPEDLAELPKAELHVHLEGSVRPATLEEFVARSGKAAPPRFTDFDSFIAAYTLAWQSMTAPGDYRRLVREYCEDALRCGVRYAELQLATTFRPYDCLAEAVEEAQRQTDVVVRFIVDAPGALPVEVSWAMLEAAKGVADVVAMGIGGTMDERYGAHFAAVFAEAKARGLRSAPHAGESQGAESVRVAMDALGAERIQHGVRTIEDAELLERIVRERLPLAACPTSNVLLGVAASEDAHQLRALWEAGACVSVHTDDPGFFGCDLTGEYALAGRMLGLDRAGYAQLAMNAVEGSFAPDDVRAEMTAAIAGWSQKG